ncbi:hypothetical protein BH18ACT10_BH18ACT10_10780 [soil metagenome]
MHTLYEMEQWQQHHDELLRKAETRRLARQLRPAQSGKWFRSNTLLKGLRFRSPRKSETAEC